MKEIIKGQIVKVQTTADECVRVTVDIDTAFAGEVNIELEEENNE